MTFSKLAYVDIAAKKVLLRNQKFKSQWLIPDENLPGREVTDVTNWIRDSGYLDKHELAITESNAPEITAKIKAREWTAYDVTSAFCHRATIAHQLVNCLSEVFFDEALERARELDEYQETHGKLVGPLHGLPISVKDNLNVKGQPTTLGIVNFCFNPEAMDSDAVLVEMFREAGAVLYVKTNVPVAMMMPETDNYVYGNTLNPLNRNLSAGGSSGGEAALLKLKGSPVGVGSDIGGSIRIPATFNNVFALKPSFGRFPTYGCRSGLPGLESVRSIIGPLSASLDSLDFLFKTVISSEPWLKDPNGIEMPWRDVELPQKLNFAVCFDDGYVRPTPPIRRGVQMVVDALKGDGHEVIEWDATDHLRLSQIIGRFFTSDGGKHVLAETTATGEKLFPYMENYGTTPELPTAELWKLQVERLALVKKYLDRWNATGLRTKNGKPIDAIIMPATPFAGNPVGKFHTYVGYTSPFNLMDYSVGVLPVTRADKNLDPADNTCTNYSDVDKLVWQDYNPEESHGGAVALQVIGRRLQEEKVLKMLRVVSDLLPPIS